MSFVSMKSIGFLPQSHQIRISPLRATAAHPRLAEQMLDQDVTRAQNIHPQKELGFRSGCIDQRL
jgi:hypothetical protein